MPTVYAIYNTTCNKVYIGQTTHLAERIKQHNDSTFQHSYTSRYQGEWKLIYQESVPTRAEALKREKQLKSYRGREFIKSFIPG